MASRPDVEQPSLYTPVLHYKVACIGDTNTLEVTASSSPERREDKAITKFITFIDSSSGSDKTMQAEVRELSDVEESESLQRLSECQLVLAIYDLRNENYASFQKLIREILKSNPGQPIAIVLTHEEDDNSYQSAKELVMWADHYGIGVYVARNNQAELRNPLTQQAEALPQSEVIEGSKTALTAILADRAKKTSAPSKKEKKLPPATPAAALPNLNNLLSLYEYLRSCVEKDSMEDVFRSLDKFISYCHKESIEIDMGSNKPDKKGKNKNEVKKIDPRKPNVDELQDARNRKIIFEKILTFLQIIERADSSAMRSANGDGIRDLHQKINYSKEQLALVIVSWGEFPTIPKLMDQYINANKDMALRILKIIAMKSDNLVGQLRVANKKTSSYSSTLFGSIYEYEKINSDPKNEEYTSRQLQIFSIIVEALLEQKDGIDILLDALQAPSLYRALASIKSDRVKQFILGLPDKILTVTEKIALSYSSDSLKWIEGVKKGMANIKRLSAAVKTAPELKQPVASPAATIDRPAARVVAPTSPAVSASPAQQGKKVKSSSPVPAPIPSSAPVSLSPSNASESSPSVVAITKEDAELLQSLRESGFNPEDLKEVKDLPKMRTIIAKLASETDEFKKLQSAADQQRSQNPTSQAKLTKILAQRPSAEYYYAVRKLLIDQFLAARSIASKQINAAADKVGSAIDIANGMVKAVPVIGVVLSIATTAAGAVHKMQRDELIRRLSDWPENMTDIDFLAEEFAQTLALIKQEKLEKLTSPKGLLSKVVEAAKKALATLIGDRPPSPAEIEAAEDATKITAAIMKGEIYPTQEKNGYQRATKEQRLEKMLVYIDKDYQKNIAKLKIPTVAPNLKAQAAARDEKLLSAESQSAKPRSSSFTTTLERMQKELDEQKRVTVAQQAELERANQQLKEQEAKLKALTDQPGVSSVDAGGNQAQLKLSAAARSGAGSLGSGENAELMERVRDLGDAVTQLRAVVEHSSGFDLSSVESSAKLKGEDPRAKLLDLGAPNKSRFLGNGDEGSSSVTPSGASSPTKEEEGEGPRRRGNSMSDFV